MKALKTTLRILTAIFILMNVMAYFHAYRFTHFSEQHPDKTPPPHKLSASARIKALVSGINNPRPVNDTIPDHLFETIIISSHKKVECWNIKAGDAKGTVILFHGYGGNKSSMLDKAGIFLELGYNTLLVDFMGSGGSEGNQTTIGYKEAEQVRSCYDYLVAQGINHIYLFGTSMGAVAILKALNDYPVMPAGIIIECPFGTMYQTVAARFHHTGVPAFPMAGLLIFWGGVQNGFAAFGHNPVMYAKGVTCPALLMYGEQDRNVCRQETDDIFANLAGRKQLVTYPLAGHENYLTRYREEWVKDVEKFLSDSKGSGSGK